MGVRQEGQNAKAGSMRHWLGRRQKIRGLDFGAGTNIVPPQDDHRTHHQ